MTPNSSRERQQVTPSAGEQPNSIEAEEALIGSVLIDPENLASVMLSTRPMDFYLVRHRHIWEAFKRLQAARMPVDLITVCDELDRAGVLRDCGGPAYLTGLVNRAAMSTNAEGYARIVGEYATRRRMISSASAIAQAAYNEEQTVSDSIAQAEKAFNSIMISQAENRAHISETLSSQYDELQENQRPPVISTGYAEINRILGGGFRGGRFYIIAGRPGEGKTSALHAWGYNAAINTAEQIGSGKKILIASLEMDRHECTDRLVAIHSGINTQRIENRMMRENEWPLYTQSVEVLSNCDIIIDDTPRQTPDHLRLTALHERPDLILVDYIQLMDSGLGPRANRNDQVTAISQSMKLLARELNTPVVAACQVSREVEKRRDKEPQNSDLRESGSLEQDADAIFFIWHNKTDKPTELVPTHMKCTKQRNGPTGTIEGLTYRRECARLEENEGQYSLPMLGGDE